MSIVPIISGTAATATATADVSTFNHTRSHDEINWSNIDDLFRLGWI